MSLRQTWCSHVALPRPEGTKLPGKARVHELAKEFGVDSKTILAVLKQMGEFLA